MRKKPMDAEQIARELLNRCTFKHPDGRPYKDDALDTWSFVYANDFPDIPWDEIDAQITRLQEIAMPIWFCVTMTETIPNTPGYLWYRLLAVEASTLEQLEELYKKYEHITRMAYTNGRYIQVMIFIRAVDETIFTHAAEQTKKPGANND